MGDLYTYTFVDMCLQDRYFVLLYSVTASKIIALV